MNFAEITRNFPPGVRGGYSTRWLEPLLPRSYRDSREQMDSAIEAMVASVKRLKSKPWASAKARGHWTILDVPWPDKASDEGCALWGAEHSMLELGPYPDEKRIYVICGLATVETKGEEPVILAGTGKRIGDGPLEHAILRPGRNYTVRTKRPTRFILSFRPQLSDDSPRKDA